MDRYLLCKMELNIGKRQKKVKNGAHLEEKVPFLLQNKVKNGAPF